MSTSKFCDRCGKKLIVNQAVYRVEANLQGPSQPGEWAPRFEDACETCVKVIFTVPLYDEEVRCG